MALIESQAVTGEEVTIANAPSPEEIEEAAALELVKNDAQSAQSWIESNQWNENWRQIDILYDSPKVFSVWENTVTQKPAVNRYILAQHVNSIHPQFIEGLFYNDDCFIAEPRPGTDAETVRARSAVVKTELDEMEFQTEVSLGLFQTVLHGTGIYKWGMKWVTEEYSEYERSAEPLTANDALGNPISVDTTESFTFKEIRKKKTILKPFFENREIRNVLVDPKLKVPDIRKAKFVIDKYYLTLDELLDLKSNPDYNLPDEDTLKSWFETPKEQPTQLGNLDTTPGSPSIAGQGVPDWMQTTDDPYENCLMVLERWDNNKVITTLNNKKVIQNRSNPYGVIPFLSSNFYNRIRSFWGLGAGKIVGTDQRVQQGLENAGLELLQLILDPPFAVSDDANVPSQNVRLRKGGIVKVKGNVRDSIAPLEMPRLPLGELFAFLQNSESKAESADGANGLFTQGAMPGPGTAGKSSATRSSAGASAVAGASATRMQGPMDLFVNQVFIPWLYQLDDLNRRFVMTTPEGAKFIKDVLEDELGKDFKFKEEDYLSGRVTFNVLAGAHLATRKLGASLMPVLMQVFNNPELQQQLNLINEKYVDIGELLLMFLETAGIRNRHSIIRNMTTKMKQNQQATNPGAQKIAAQQAGKQQDFQNSQELLKQKGEQGIARDVINRSLDQGGDYLLRQSFEQSPGELEAEQ